MSEIKKCFVSRWGDEGGILEVDFSQLEVVGVAFLSQDENLIADIKDGVDLHCMSASFLYGEPYEEIYKAVKAKDKTWIKRRALSKGPTFQLQYGSGANGISKKCGIPKEQAESFISRYYDRYSQLKAWQDDNIQRVESSRRPTNRRGPTGYPLGEGFLYSITGRAYCFREEETPAWLQRKGLYTSFQPPQIKNYPSQGFATGDIVPMCVGELYYELKADEELREKALLTNTVHDSVLLDVHTGVREKATQTAEKVLQSAPELLKMHFGIEFNLPLKVESEWGSSWGTMS